MENVKKYFFVLSFVSFELWVYYVFSVSVNIPVWIQKFSNQYWLLFATSIVCLLAGIIVGIYYKPISQKISQLEHRVNNEDRVAVFAEGVIQIFAGVVIILMDMAFYPSRVIFLMLAILGILIFINGVKYFNASFKY